MADWYRRFDRLTPAVGLLGVLLLLSAGGARLVTGEVAGPVQILLASGAALTVYWIAGSLADLREAATSRTTRYGSNALVAVIAVAVILGFANFLSTRYSNRWDVTRNRQNSISDQTVKVLASLKDPIKITAFYSTDNPSKSTTDDLMKEYLVRTDKLSIDYVDPVAEPAKARTLGVRLDGTLVFESKGRRTEATSASETSITGALLKVSSDVQKKIYFTNGNGEADIASSDRGGFSTVKTQLERLNYATDSLNLLSSPVVPADASVVVIAGPRRPLADSSRKALSDYLAAGGHALVLLDPRSQSGLDSVLADYGLKIGDGIIVDPALAFGGADPLAPVVQRYPFSQITRDLGPTVFPLVTSVERAENVTTTLSVQPLLESSDRSWLDRNPERPQYDEGVDKKGPLTLAASVERLRSGGSGSPGGKAENLRLVVMGNSDFATNQFTGPQTPYNIDLVLNSVNWLAEEEALISIAPKTPDENLRMVLSPIQTNLIIFSSVLFLPLAIAGAGLTVWWQRR